MLKPFSQLLCITLIGCSTDGCRKAAESKSAELNHADSLFLKRVECGHFLEKVQGSITGPELPQRKDQIFFNPLVFYNSTLNTCVRISQSESLFGDYKHRLIMVDDLLTGKSLEIRDIDVSKPDGQQQAKQIADEVEAKYNK